MPFRTPPCVADVDAPVVRADANALANVDMTGKTLVVRYEPAPGTPTAGQPNQSAPNAPPALRNWARAMQRTVTPQNPAAESSRSSPMSSKTSGIARQSRFRAARTAWIPTAPPISAWPRAACRCFT